MNKCDKCGCEHNATGTCPRCGAPVITVNSDYLRRKMEYEEKLKNGGAAPSLEEIYFGKKSKGDNRGSDSRKKNAKPRKTAPQTISYADEDEMGWQAQIKRPEISKKNGKRTTVGNEERKPSAFAKVVAIIYVSILKLINGIKDTKERNRRRGTEGQNIEFADNDENAMYEKLILEHVVFKSKLKRCLIIGGAVAIVLVGGFFAVRSIVLKDRSKIVYYDGKTVYQGDKAIFDTGLEGRDYSFVAYNDDASAFFMKNSEVLMARYNNAYVPLFGKASMLTTQYAMTKNGKYLAYVLYDEARERYTLCVNDLNAGKNAVYENEKFLEIDDISETGQVIYTAYETMEHSIVVDSTLMIADMDRNITVGGGVSEVLFSARDSRIYFVSEGDLYSLGISDKEIKDYPVNLPKSSFTPIYDEVASLQKNKLGEEILFVDNEGFLRLYEGGKITLLASGLNGNEEIYLGEGYIYSSDANAVYMIEDGGVTPLYKKSVSSTIIEQEGALYGVDNSGNLWRLDGKGQTIVDTEISDIAEIDGSDCITYVKNGVQHYTDFVKKDNILVDKTSQAMCYKTIKSGKYWYYVDQNNILWRKPETGGNAESMGYAAFVMRIK